MTKKIWPAYWKPILKIAIKKRKKEINKEKEKTDSCGKSTR